MSGAFGGAFRLADLAERMLLPGRTSDWDEFHASWARASDEDKRAALIIACDRAAQAVTNAGS